MHTVLECFRAVVMEREKGRRQGNQKERRCGVACCNRKNMPGLDAREANRLRAGLDEGHKKSAL